MHITTLTAPIILRDYLLQSDTLKKMLTFTNSDGEEETKIYPLNAPTDKNTEEPVFKNEFITYSRTGYDMETGGGNHINYKRTNLEVECFSPTYDVALFEMIAEVEKIVTRMKNDGFTVDITDADEYQYAFREGGKTWYCERIHITIENVSAERED